MRRAWVQVTLIALVLVSVTCAVRPIPEVHAAGTLSIVTSSVTPVPQGTMIKFDVRVDGVDQFNLWHIDISTDTRALNGTSIDHSTQNVFPGIPLLYLADCINGGIPGANTGCHSGEDRLGIIHVETTLLGQPTQPPHSGVLFSVNFLAGAANFTNIHFVTNLLEYTCGVGCVVDANPTPVDFVYGTPPSPDFSLTLKKQSLSVIQGSTVETNITASSTNDFIGQVNFTSSVVSSGVGASGIVVTFLPNNVTLNNSTGLAKVVISVAVSAIATGYSVNVTGTSNGLAHYALLALSVERPGDFSLGFFPQTLPIPPSSSASTTVLLTSASRSTSSQEFSGEVFLSLTAPRNRWTNAPVNATLGQTSLNITAGGTSSTLLSVSVPPSPFPYSGPFTYLINVTAVSATNPNLNQTQTLMVVPPASDLNPIVIPDTLTIHAGQTGTTTLSVIGVNYFTGSIYPSSTLIGGTTKYDASYRFMLNGVMIAFSLNLTIDPDTAPGNYVALLTVQGQTQFGATFARSIGLPIAVVSSSHSVQLPTKILGLTVPVYFGILGGFSAIFVLLAALFYRKTKSDKDEWE